MMLPISLPSPLTLALALLLTTTPACIAAPFAESNSVFSSSSSSSPSSSSSYANRTAEHVLALLQKHKRRQEAAAAAAGNANANHPDFAPDGAPHPKRLADIGAPFASVPVIAEDRDGGDAWLLGVKAGTPAQGPLRLDLDTGSDFTWTRDTIYNATKSSTAVNTTEPFKAYYIGFGSQGWILEDTMSLTLDAAVRKQRFGLAPATMDAYDQGLVGFSPTGPSGDSLVIPNSQSFFAELRDQHAGVKDVFALTPNPPTLHLGGLDASKCKDDVDVTWGDGSSYTPGIGWLVGNGTVNGIDLSKVIVDSGGTVIALPTAKALKLCQDVGGKIIADIGGGTCGFPSPADVPAITFTLGSNNKSFTIPGHILARPAIDPYPATWAVWGYDEIGLEDLTLLGTPFLKTVCAVFWGSMSTTPTMGLARLR